MCLKGGKARRLLICIGWLAAWQLLSLCVDNSILMVGPLQTARALWQGVWEGLFWKTVFFSILRIAAGFLVGFTLGAILAAGSFRFPWLEEALEPPVKLLKAAPVASVTVLLLIWWGASFLSVAVTLLVVLPQVYISVLEGLRSTDRKLLEMSAVFRVPFWNRFFYLYRPALKPFLDGCLKLSLGMSWKSGVAAEVIGTPDYSIGERLYLSKIYLDTAGVFAWTLVIIALSICCEKAALSLWGRFLDWRPACAKPVKPAGRKHGLYVEHVSKSYDGRRILTGFSACYEPGGVYFLTQPSGSGKTTLLRILAGLEKADEGSVPAVSAAMVFQENRLCEQYDAVKNVELATGDPQGACRALKLVLPEDALAQPCGQLSGGMKRRVALVRAMEAESDVVLLDEPLTGLDEDNRRKTIRYILEKQQGRTLLIATHSQEDIRYFRQLLLFTP